MAILDSTLTDTEFCVLLDALDQWEQVGQRASKHSRREAATLIKAKLFLQRQSARIDQLFDEAMATHSGVSHRMRLAEQFMLECGILKHFEEYLTSQH